MRPWRAERQLVRSDRFRSSYEHCRHVCIDERPVVAPDDRGGVAQLVVVVLRNWSEVPDFRRRESRASFPTTYIDHPSRIATFANTYLHEHLITCPFILSCARPERQCQKYLYSRIPCVEASAQCIRSESSLLFPHTMMIITDYAGCLVL